MINFSKYADAFTSPSSLLYQSECVGPTRPGLRIVPHRKKSAVMSPLTSKLLSRSTAPETPSVPSVLTFPVSALTVNLLLLISKSPSMVADSFTYNVLSNLVAPLTSRVVSKCVAPLTSKLLSRSTAPETPRVPSVLTFPVSALTVNLLPETSKSPSMVADSFT